MILQLSPDEAGRYEPFPVTEMQQAYWLGRSAEFQLGGIGIHLYEELDCEGLDADRLSACWQETLVRHDALRTVILRDGRQRVLPKTPKYRIGTVDLSGQSESAAQARLREIRERLCHRSYAVEEWPSFELLACRLDAQRTRLYISLDLTHLDLHGLGVVFRDWIQAYFGEPLGFQTPLRFRDYALALKDLKETELVSARKWWSEVLAALPPSPALPFAKPLISVSAPRFQRRCAVVDSAQWDRIKTHAGRAGITPSCLALAVYCEVIRLWSAEPAFTVNIALRNSLAGPAMAEVAGMLTSAAPIAASASGKTWVERAQTLQQEMTDLLRHRSACGVGLLREYAALHGRHASEAVFPVVYTSSLNVAPHPFVELERLGMRVSNLIQTPQVCLDLQLYQRGSELVIHWDTVADLFPLGLPEEMCQAYQDALTSVASESAWSRRGVVGLPGSQRERRNAVNATGAPLSKENLVQFSWARVRKDDERDAVITPGETITRAQLYQAARDLARRMRLAGLASGELVAVTLQKGWEQFAAVHAVVMAGAAYVPVPPDLPVCRREFLLRNAGACMVITTRRLRDCLQWPHGMELICIDDPELNDEPAGVYPTPSPHDLAYVLYTSGSTGEPKGVMIRQASVVNRLADINERFGIRPDDRVFAITAYHHDLSVYDLFGTIAAGAAAVVPDAEGVRDPAVWAELMRQHHVTVWNSVPAFLEMLVTFLENSGPSKIPGELRLVLLAGDWIPMSLPGRLRALIPDARVISLGGPTETTIWDICYPVSAVDPSWTSIPYGQPLRNSRYYVMNRCLEERPDWVQGELYIAGAGLAEGYWKDPIKTEERFIEHPETGERLYRSEDLGRFLPDGNIEFLGRADSQLKISGIRIEAGEVASAIRKHPDVDDVIVRAIGGQDRGRTLAAYVVTSKRAGGYHPNGKVLSEEALLEHRLRQPGVQREKGEGSPVQLTHGASNGQTSTEYRTRVSCRAFTGETIPLGSFSGLLSQLRGIVPPDGSPLPKYLYPSAGSLYPVRTYVCIKAGAVAEIAAGAYYYHPVDHQLKPVGSDIPDSSAHLKHNRYLADASGFLIVLAAHLPAVEPVYDGLSRDYCLLEAGYIGQLLMMRAHTFGIGLCPIGDFDRGRLGTALGLGPKDEIVHALAGGIPSGADPRASADACTTAGHERMRREILEILRQDLPQECIPRSIVFLNAFPLSPNGKVNLVALSAACHCEGNERPPVAAASERERELAAMLSEVLENGPVCVERKFLEQGCNSIQLVRFMVQLQRNAGYAVTISDLFAHPSVRSLARFLSGTCSPGPGEDAIRRAALRLQMRCAHAR
jgi:epothilone synthetase B